MKFTELLDDLNIDYMEIESLRYDDNNGTSYLIDNLLRVGIRILNDEAIEISDISKFIGAFSFKNYKIYHDNSYIILEDKKLRYLEIYLK